MGFLKKFFGGGESTVEGLRKAVSQKRYADARVIAEQLIEKPQNESDATEVEELRIVSLDGLAQLNLNEALGLQRCGNFEGASDHLMLAKEQACSPDLCEEIEQALAAEPQIPEIDSSGEGQSGSCATCISKPKLSAANEDLVPDDGDIQLELILTSYPEELQQRYLGRKAPFSAAFLLSHAGDDEHALPLWQQVAEEDRDDLYWFELGSLMGRNGNLEDARSFLENALEKNPELSLAMEALVSVFAASGDLNLAEDRLQLALKQGISPSFCYSQLTSLSVHRKEFSLAAEYARKGVAAGNGDAQFILLAASVLEHVGALAETESVLTQLPAAGCKGGTNLPLAEFWLRQKRELANILDTFNAACRDYPDEPRWQLRVAQTYIARNWTKDGVKLLRKVVDDPRLEAELAEEAQTLLAEHQG